VIEIGVEKHREGVVAFERVVATQFRGANLRRGAVDELGRDVDVRLVVGDADARRLGRLGALLRLALLEPRHDRHGLPHRVGEAAIDDRRRGDLARLRDEGGGFLRERRAGPHGHERERGHGGKGDTAQVIHGHEVD